MLKLSINQDPSSGRIITERSVSLGDMWPIAVVAEDDGEAPSPATFDTIIVEILFNDGAQVLSVDPRQQPVAGDLAQHGTTGVDAFRRQAVRVVQPEELALVGVDMRAPLEAELTLRLPLAGDPVGVYTMSTGRAGLHAPDQPFTVEPGNPKIIAMGKKRTGIVAGLTGVSHVIPVATVLRGAESVPYRAVVGTVTVA